MTDQIGPLPAITLEPGMTLVFRAVDLTTGANVADVPVSEISIYVDSEGAGDIGVPVPDVLPVFPYGANV